MFIETLVCLLGLNLKAAESFKDSLLKKMSISNIALEDHTQEEGCNFDDVITDAMRGKIWFRARVPDSKSFLCGITDTSIELGDELLFFRDLLHGFVGEAIMNGMIIRCTSTTERATGIRINLSGVRHFHGRL